MGAHCPWVVIERERETFWRSGCLYRNKQFKVREEWRYRGGLLWKNTRKEGGGEGRRTKEGEGIGFLFKSAMTLILLPERGKRKRKEPQMGSLISKGQRNTGT